MRAGCERWCIALCVALALSPGVSPRAAAQDQGATTASTSVYVRSDTDETTVVTPRVHVGAPVGDEGRLDLVYTVDVWSSASIDIRTAASKRVVEQRDEIDVSGEQRVGDLALGASYRYSTEYDYESHGGSLGVASDFADKAANASLTLRAYFDKVGRAGDANFERDVTQLSARAAFTQVLGPDTLVQAIYEVTSQRGYQSSPYRFVRFAETADAVPRTCQLPLMMCLPERSPEERLRHAIAVTGRHALTGALSAGASYRFYFDDWDMTSHTAGVDAALALDPGWLLSLGYRFYTQSKASHYEPVYVVMPMQSLPEHYASDKELSTLSSHRGELELARRFELDDVGTELETVLLVSPTFYSYADFPLLDSVTALEVSLAMELRL